MFARFDENPAMTLRVIKETKRYGRADGQTHGRTDNVKTVYPLQTKFAGGITRRKNPLVLKGLIRGRSSSYIYCTHQPRLPVVSSSFCLEYYRLVPGLPPSYKASLHIL